MLQCVKASGGSVESQFEMKCADCAEPSRMSDVVGKAVVAGWGLWRLSLARSSHLTKRLEPFLDDRDTEKSYFADAGYCALRAVTM